MPPTAEERLLQSVVAIRAKTKGHSAACQRQRCVCKPSKKTDLLSLLVDCLGGDDRPEGPVLDVHSLVYEYLWWMLRNLLKPARTSYRWGFKGDEGLLSDFFMSIHLQPSAGAAMDQMGKGVPVLTHDAHKARMRDLKTGPPYGYNHANVAALQQRLDRTTADRAAPLDRRARTEVAQANPLIERLAEQRRRRVLAERLGIYAADDEGSDDDDTRTAPAGVARRARSLLPQTAGYSSAGRTIRNAADYLALLMRGEAPPDLSFATLLEERPGLGSVLVHCGVPLARLRELADSSGNPQALLPWDEVQRQLGIGPHSRVEQMLRCALWGVLCDDRAASRRRQLPASASGPGTRDPPAAAALGCVARTSAAVPPTAGTCPGGCRPGADGLRLAAPGYAPFARQSR